MKKGIANVTGIVKREQDKFSLEYLNFLFNKGFRKFYIVLQPNKKGELNCAYDDKVKEKQCKTDCIDEYKKVCTKEDLFHWCKNKLLNDKSLELILNIKAKNHYAEYLHWRDMSSFLSEYKDSNFKLVDHVVIVN